MLLGRNDACHCGSGKKYKHCHLGSDSRAGAVESGSNERAGEGEIRRILRDDFGFTDLEAYRRWVRDVRPRLSPTPELVKKLSPDRVDCRAFWRVCEELFGIDPVHNVVVAPEVGELPYAVETQIDANRMNLRLAKSFAITAFLEENAHRRLRVLEVGPGFGSLKSFIEAETDHEYFAVDVLPRFDGVVEATSEGNIPRNFVDVARGTFSYVVSTNVLQHFSARQRTQCYVDAHTLLRDQGLWIFNLLVDTAKLAPRARDRNGNAWCDHYGQFTEIPKLAALHDEVGKIFRILYVTQRYDGVCNFVCQKRG
ncbi:MAG TPA: SEC-C metal-binding domain-containing protein [Polyangiaceae bacterium]|nr:SEC-C metal-binding domain-containing protein [Polyangiaceae bacterium]